MISTTIRPAVEPSQPSFGQRDSFLSAACTLAFRICREAFWYGNKCNWIGQKHDHKFGGNPPLICANLDMSVYNGTAGIAHFLKTLHLFYPNPVIKKTTLGAIRHALHQEAEAPNRIRHSFWTGPLGVALVALDLAQAFDEPSLQMEASAILKSILAADIDHNDGLDILEGSAGAILAMLQYRSLVSKESLEPYLEAQAKRILSQSKVNEIGRSWASSHDPETALLGYAHGTAGFAHALIELGTFFEKDEFSQAGQEAIHFENSWMDAGAKNWPDLRITPETNKEEPKFMNAWCHGAMGIGLSRLRCFELLGDESFLDDVEMSLSHLAPSIDIQKASACLCHGWSGNAELALYASQVLNQPHLLDMIHQQADQAVEVFLKRGQPWMNGLQNHAQIPGLMDGSAGLGYFFLRLYDPTQVPSLLLMKPK